MEFDPLYIFFMPFAIFYRRCVFSEANHDLLLFLDSLSLLYACTELTSMRIPSLRSRRFTRASIDTYLL